MEPAPSSRVRDRRASVGPGARLAGLFDEHARMVLGVCRAVLGDPDEAEDAAQQTFLSAYRSLLAGVEPQDVAAWLAAIARNESRARIRKRQVVPLPLDRDAAASVFDVADAAAEREEVGEITAAIAELPPRQREALVLRDFYGLSYRDAAAALSVSLPAAEVLVFRARKRVRELVGRAPDRVCAPLALPSALREALARTVPGFDAAGGVGVGAAAAAGVAAKGGGAPLALKLTAATVAALAAGVAGDPRGPALMPAAVPDTAKAASGRTVAVAVGAETTRLERVNVRPATRSSGEPKRSERSGNWHDGATRRRDADGRSGDAGPGSSGGSGSSGSGGSGSSSGSGTSSGSGSSTGPSASSGPSGSSGPSASNGSGETTTSSGPSGSSASTSSGSGSSGSGSSGSSSGPSPASEADDLDEPDEGSGGDGSSGGLSEGGVSGSGP